MKNIGNIIKRLQNTMRKDQGVSGDAQRIEQLGWMIALKILDDKDQELEIIQDGYVSPIPSALQWRNSAADSEVRSRLVLPAVSQPLADSSAEVAKASAGGFARA